MSTQQLQDDFPEHQAAIYGVALSLDAFLINGILYGVLQRDYLPDFLEKTAHNLFRELARLEALPPHIPPASQSKVADALAALRSKCQQLIDLVSGLIVFRSLPLEMLRSMVSQIPLLREACVRQIQELEACFQVPKPFYQSRPEPSTAEMNNFLAALENIFTQEWNDSAKQKVPTLP